MLSQEQIQQRTDILAQHRKLILQIRTFEKEITSLISSGRDWRTLEDKRNEFYLQIEPLIEAYWQWIPLVKLSQCPICQHETHMAFDPIDFHGFWWMDRTQRKEPPSNVCKHFQLLLGAVHLNGHRFPQTLFQCNPGPDKPYVIPRLIHKEGIMVIISKINMDCGFTAYPICYFSKTPIAEQQLTQSWVRKEHLFATDDGRRGWDIRDEERDFDIEKWQQAGKILQQF